MSENKSFKNKVALKRGLYAVILSVVLIIALILVNVLATALADRYPLDLDLTANKIHSMNADNIEYIKSVDKDVTIYVCLPEDDYACNENASSYSMIYYATMQRFVDYNAKNASYFTQTVELLRKYEKYNSHIHVQFIDVAKPSASEITDDFKDYEWTEGDFLIAAEVEKDGTTSVRRTVISFNDLYTLEPGDESTEQYAQYSAYGMMNNYAAYGYGLGYMITENKLEYALSSAIFRVVSDKTPVYLYPSAYGDTAVVKDRLDATLTANNYSLVYVDGFLSSILSPDNYDSYDGIVLAGMNTDISLADREAIEKFLDNGGRKGKTLFHFANLNTHKQENLCALLGDWAIGYKDGIVFESTGSVLDDDNTNIQLKSAETDYTKTTDNLSGTNYLLSSNTIPMEILYTSNTTGTYSREATALMRTASLGTATIMPISEDPLTFKPAEDAVYDAFPTAILCEDSSTYDNVYVSSFVVSFASGDMINAMWNSYTTCKNLNFVLDTFNSTTEGIDSGFNFAAKTISSESYFTSDTDNNVVRIAFVVVIPVLLIAAGIIVTVRRKRR